MTATMLPDHPLTTTEFNSKRLDAGSRNHINGVNCGAGYVLFSDGSTAQLTAWMDQDGNLTDKRALACHVFYERDGQTLIVELEQAWNNGVIIDDDQPTH
jgi:hypothetical protein